MSSRPHVVAPLCRQSDLSETSRDVRIEAFGKCCPVREQLAGNDLDDRRDFLGDTFHTDIDGFIFGAAYSSNASAELTTAVQNR